MENMHTDVNSRENEVTHCRGRELGLTTLINIGLLLDCYLFVYSLMSSFFLFRLCFIPEELKAAKKYKLYSES